MLLSISVAGLPFVGADVSGFFGDPDPELVCRWYQAAAFQPFFRGHAHIDSKPREPWVFGEETLANIKHSIWLRYSLLPLWYTVFHEHERTGLPVMRPLWSLAFQDEATFAIGDQWLVGNELLVTPVTKPGVTDIDVYLPGGYGWYQFEGSNIFFEGGQTIHSDAPMGKIPLFQRAGSIIPRRMRMRRSTRAMHKDPFTLSIAIDPISGNAKGSLYIDDESTFAYKNSDSYCNVEFNFSAAITLLATSQCKGEFSPDIKFERVVFMGIKSSPKKVTLAGTNLQVIYEYDSERNVLSVRKPVDRFFVVPLKLELIYEEK